MSGTIKIREKNTSKCSCIALVEQAKLLVSNNSIYVSYYFPYYEIDSLLILLSFVEILLTPLSMTELGSSTPKTTMANATGLLEHSKDIAHYNNYTNYYDIWID